MLIFANELVQTPWKNGGGLTTEILRSPNGAANYDWRVSFAHVSADGPFSNFPGYDRALLVWEGEGLRLNDTELLPLTPHYFRGEDVIHAELLSGSVIDLGCIFRRATQTCTMEIVAKITGRALYFILDGSLKIEAQTLGRRDSFLNEGEVAIASDDFRAVKIELNLVG